MTVSYYVKVFDGFWAPEAGSQSDIDQRKSIQVCKTTRRSLDAIQSKLDELATDPLLAPTPLSHRKKLAK